MSNSELKNSYNKYYPLPHKGDKRAVLHLDMDTFFVSVERVADSRLKGKPVIIGGTSDRGVVSSCSYEARMYGVHSAMPVKMALRLCPEATLIRGDIDLYNRYSSVVTDIIAERAPVYEKRSIDEYYIDLTGMERFYGCRKWSEELRRYISSETGLPLSAGLSINKTVSKIAAGEAKPDGIRSIDNKMVTPFLDPLAVTRIPMVGSKTGRILSSMGVSIIATLRQIPPSVLTGLIGKNGIEIWRRANGIDDSPVTGCSSKKSVSSERTLQRDSSDITAITALLSDMTERLSHQLRAEGRNTSCITVKIRYSDYETHTIQKKIKPTALDHKILTVVKELFNKLYKRRVLIRLAGVKLSGLSREPLQPDLFNNETGMERLYLSIDNIKKRFGEEIIGRADTLSCRKGEHPASR